MLKGLSFYICWFLAIDFWAGQFWSLIGEDF